MAHELEPEERLEQARRMMASGFPGEAPELVEHLLGEAEAARANAYAPYSRFAVGAALLDAEGRVHRGCNVENASYGATLCAERGAVAQMVAAGSHRVLVALVIGSGSTAVPPCGPCRQVLSEFGAEFVISVGPDGELRSWSMDALFPDPVSGADIGPLGGSGPVGDSRSIGDSGSS